MQTDANPDASQIAFDASQKAVLTSCVLINQSVLSRKRKKAGANKAKVLEDAMVNACFSFVRLGSPPHRLDADGRFVLR